MFDALAPDSRFVGMIKSSRKSGICEVLNFYFHIYMAGGI